MFSSDAIDAFKLRGLFCRRCLDVSSGLFSADNAVDVWSVGSICTSSELSFARCDDPADVSSVDSRVSARESRAVKTL